MCLWGVCCRWLGGEIIQVHPKGVGWAEVRTQVQAGHVLYIKFWPQYLTSSSFNGSGHLNWRQSFAWNITLCQYSNISQRKSKYKKVHEQVCPHVSCRIVEWWGGLLLMRHIHLSLLSDRLWEADTPGLSTLQLTSSPIRAVKCLWVTTYPSNWIIYFCSNVLRWFYFIHPSNPVCILFLCLPVVWVYLLLQEML